MIQTTPKTAVFPGHRFVYEKERYQLLALSPVGILLQHEEEPSRALLLTHEQITEASVNGILRAETPLPVGNR
ncbi:hypothetical protein [Rhizobium ruizarguesonis]|jgi:hypothetical protein|uniref:hypothetical protein n=1 Tax=Rhizobium ruizarguesonis TaxID=2081791 RepID=UPI00102FAD28|nr:hypothetical protein [Rhizobium ruizarguesonis]TBC79524.1 hypothetical protein ELH30_16845 [Rhizobium ruizarguesonis]